MATRRKLAEERNRAIVLGVLHSKLDTQAGLAAAVRVLECAIDEHDEHQRTRDNDPDRVGCGCSLCIAVEAFAAVKP